MRTDYEFGAEDMDDVIDEEELVMLREQKDCKKHYRDLFADLKKHKENSHDSHAQIDILKEKLLVYFEEWYGKTFERGAVGVEQTQFKMEESRGDLDGTMIGVQEDVDDEQALFKRAKRNVDTLHRARKMDKTQH